MSHLITAIFGKPHWEVTDRELLKHLIKEFHAMTLDLSKVNTSLTKLSADVDALITNDGAVATAVDAATAVHQAQVDGLAPNVDVVSAKIEAVLNPPAAPTPAPVA